MEKYLAETDVREKACGLMVTDVLTITETRAQWNSIMAAAAMEAFTWWRIRR